MRHKKLSKKIIKMEFGLWGKTADNKTLIQYQLDPDGIPVFEIITQYKQNTQSIRSTNTNIKIENKIPGEKINQTLDMKQNAIVTTFQGPGQKSTISQKADVVNIKAQKVEVQADQIDMQAININLKGTTIKIKGSAAAIIKAGVIKLN